VAGSETKILFCTVYHPPLFYEKPSLTVLSLSVNPSNIVQNSVAPVKGHYQVSF